MDAMSVEQGKSELYGFVEFQYIINLGTQKFRSNNIYKHVSDS